MIGKGKAISHTANGIEYAKEKLNAVEIDRNLVAGETPKDISKEFEVFQDMNKRCEKDTFSFVVSPSIEDSKNLTKQDFQDITKDFLKELDLDKNQYVAYLHTDKQHAHIHIFCNRIDEKGKAMKDNYIGKRSRRAVEKIAKERNFTLAKDVQKQKIVDLQPQVEKAHKKAMEQTPKNIAEYSKLMEKQGVKIHPKFSSQNKCVGMKFQVGEKMIKGSALGKAFSGMRIETAILNQVAKVMKINKDKSKGIDFGPSL